MSVLILIAIVAGFTAVGLLTVLAFRQASAAHRQTATMMAALDSVARQLSSANHTLNGRLDGVSGELTRTLSESLQKTTQALTGSIGSVREETRAKIDEKFVQITERLGDLKATNERIMEFSRSLDDFQRMLQSPKLRGDFGEFTLEQMLANLLPAECYELPGHLRRRQSRCRDSHAPRRTLRGQQVPARQLPTGAGHERPWRARVWLSRHFAWT